MTQSTDTETTQPMPVIDADATVTMPVIAPAVAVVPVPPPFNEQREHQLHVHRVLGRILRTPDLPLPSLWEGHLYSTGPVLGLYLGTDDSLDAYAKVFGGAQASEDRVSVVDGSPSRMDTLSTVIEGVNVTVSRWTYLPVAEASEPESQHDPAPETPAETPVEHPEAA